MRKLLFVLMILMIPLASALVYPSGSYADIKIPCYNSSSNFCSSDAVCNLSITYPNGTILISGKQMQNQGAYHNYTLDSSQTNVIGTYSGFAVCKDVNEYGNYNFEYEITFNGKLQSVPQAMASLGYLLLLVCLTCFFFYLGFKFTESDYLWVLGFFFIVFGMFLLIYDVWLGYEYQQLLTGLQMTGVINIIFYTVFLAITAGLVVSLAVMFKNWKRIKNEIVKAVNEKEDEDEDGWDKNDFDNK